MDISMRKMSNRQWKRGLGYLWLILGIRIVEPRSLAYQCQWQFHHIILSIVIGDIAIAPQKIRTRYFAVIVEKFFSRFDRFDSPHHQKLFFLEESRLRKRGKTLVVMIQQNTSD